MGKPKAPKPPDYAAAAKEQGAANLNSALATNYLNQVNQVTPEGSLQFTYDPNNMQTLPDGTKIPQATATTTLSPEQQKLYDQNTQLSINLNDLAGKGIGYVADATKDPLLASQFAPLQHAPTADQFKGMRDDATNAILDRLLPLQQRDRAALETKLVNQGFNRGAEGFTTAMDDLGRQENDARIQALLAGNQVENQMFNQGLASSQFNNQAQNQAIQEADYFKNQPLNMLNALRTGNQVTSPTFGNYATGANVQAAPVYQAAADQYNAQLNNYQNKLSGWNSLLGGLGSLGAAAILR